jgi:hypothetical protein
MIKLKTKKNIFNKGTDTCFIICSFSHWIFDFGFKGRHRLGFSGSPLTNKYSNFDRRALKEGYKCRFCLVLNIFLFTGKNYKWQVFEERYNYVWGI